MTDVSLPAAAIAGVLSFLSPCVLPLVPGYVSYTTGLVGADLGEAKRDPVEVLRVDHDSCSQSGHTYTVRTSTPHTNTWPE